MGISERPTRPRRAFLKSSLALAPVMLAAQATPQIINGDDPTEKRLPNGKLQSEVILKADYDENLKDARELTELAKSIELELDKNDQNVLSLGLLKKLDDVEKITKRMRARVRR